MMQMNVPVERCGMMKEQLPVSASSGGQTIQCSESIFYHNAF